MKPKFLERKFTLMSDFFYVLYVTCIGFPIQIGFLQASNRGTASIVFLTMAITLIGIPAYLIIRTNRFNNHLKLHNTELGALSQSQNGSKLVNAQDGLITVPPEIANASIRLIANRDLQILNYMTTPDWNYIDLSYGIYRQIKNGEYKAELAYYSVLSAKLPRVLPNVFFDSKQEGGRQYKSQFAKDQKHLLEGDFNDYFDTYFAKDYTIDSMSFITPDVMQALKDIDNYDVEIIGDRLLLYGPVYLESAETLKDVAKLQTLQKTLAVTAASYRDERITGAAAATAVTPEGLQLRRRRKSVWLTIVFITIITYLQIARFGE